MLNDYMSPKPAKLEHATVFSWHVPGMRLARSSCAPPDMPCWAAYLLADVCSAHANLILLCPGMLLECLLACCWRPARIPCRRVSRHVPGMFFAFSWCP